jgi:hypothetical protein
VGTALPGDLAVWDGHVAMIVNGIRVEAGNLEGFFLRPAPKSSSAVANGG